MTPRHLVRAAVRARLERPDEPRLFDDDPAIDRVLDSWRRREVEVVVPGHPDWPERLAVLQDAPDLLAVRGTLDPNRPAAAIVGQRRATPYGREVAAWIADGIARAGVTVVSGGAVGIDAAAHRAAVDADAPTTVVLGCGHAVPYPRPHAVAGGLFDRVVETGGGIVSECLPDAEPKAFRVLARNRLIAALADVVVVVEGQHRSGALNTASHAADQGVPVLAVPGDVRAPGSAAPLRLLAEGAGPCRGPEDVLAAIGQGLGVDPDDLGPGPDPTLLPEAVRGVLGAMFPRPIPLDDLARQSGMAVGGLMALVTRARIAGLVTSDETGIRLRRALR